MNVTVESSGNLMIAYLIGELDHHSAGAVRDKIDSSISCMKPNHLILDFKKMFLFMDSSGIGLVMGRYRLMQKSSRLG
ncbi:MAG: STAS domain-containing protein [Anaerotruncus sp.]|nr:MAG: STAS domain-containing protein [Anaerotruncus sp.]